MTAADPAPVRDRCEATLWDDRRCSQVVSEDIVGIGLCSRHHRKAVDEVLLWNDARRRHFERVGEEAVARLARLERVRPSFKKLANGWTFYLALPGFDGESRRQLRRRGFATKIDAQREARAILDSLKAPLRSSVEAYTAAVAQQQRDTAERCRRQAAEAEAAQLAARAAATSASAARREQERARTVYYVRRPDDAIKIGTTWNLKARMQAFRNATPVELLASHSGGQVAEAALHRRFKHLRLDGEWFHPGQDLLAHIRHVVGRADHHAKNAAGPALGDHVRRPGSQPEARPEPVRGSAGSENEPQAGTPSPAAAAYGLRDLGGGLFPTPVHPLNPTLPDRKPILTAARRNRSPAAAAVGGGVRAGGRPGAAAGETRAPARPGVPPTPDIRKENA